MDEVRKLDVVVDSCPTCGGMWLDRGELDKLRSSTQELRQEAAHSSANANDRDHRDNPNRSSHDRDSHGHRTDKKKKKSAFDLLDIFGG